jgi:GNAT superfamily N-acetyltransferase
MTDAITTPARTTIRTLDAAEAGARLDELAAILVDAVAQGASVNFMAGFSHEEGRAFWRRQLPGLADGEKILFVGEDRGRLIATVMLMHAPQPNAPHRADVGKMLVHSSARRQGLGRRLHRSCGWREIGTVPDHSYKTNGRLAETTFFYKWLDPARAARPVRAAAAGVEKE